LRHARVRSRGFEASDECTSPLNALLAFAYCAQEITIWIEGHDNVVRLGRKREPKGAEDTYSVSSARS
jgi:hypothetical protein